MSVFSCEIQGLDKVKEMFASMGYELSASQMRGILDVAGKQIIDEAKSVDQFKGNIGRDFEKDLAVQRDHRKSAKNAEYVLVGPRFRPYMIHGQEQKVALIAQHMTIGFRQTERLTKTGQRRGRVLNQEINPMITAAINTEPRRNEGVDKGIEKQVKKIKYKYSSLVR